MNQICKVCGEPAAGFHFGAFTCEGCKSFFGRSYNNLASISECKNNGKCIIDKKNRTTCKACRLRKCYNVGMSKGGSRYGRRSNWFKIHCLLQEQQQQALETASKCGTIVQGIPHPSSGSLVSFNDMTVAAATAAAAAAAAQQQLHQRSATGTHLQPPTPLGYTNLLPDISTASFIPTAATIPFFSMMNTLPGLNAGSVSSAFQVPTRLLYGGYTHAVPINADTANPLNLYAQSIDTISSAGSQCISPSSPNQSIHSLLHDESITNQSKSITPDLCPCNINKNENENENENEYQSIRTAMTSISSTLPISSPLLLESSSINQTQLSPLQIPIKPKPIPIHNYNIIKSNSSHDIETNITAKTILISSNILSHKTSLNITEHFNPDIPIDLSMKTLRESVHNVRNDILISNEMKNIKEDKEKLNNHNHNNNNDNGLDDHDNNDDDDDLQKLQEQQEKNKSEQTDEQQKSLESRRKFYQLQTESENSDNSINSFDSEHIKRMKYNENVLHPNYNGHDNTSIRGIYVCV